MKCTSKKCKIVSLCCLLAFNICLTGCGSISYELPYHTDSSVSSFNIVSKENHKTSSTYATNLCIVTDDMAVETVEGLSNATAAILCDVDNKEAVYAKNVHEALYPASITKVMTALVALKYGDSNQVLTATGAVNVTESGATLCGLKSGDTMTLDQALRILLVYSANDVALLIAENIGGTVDGFVQMMNEEAGKIGATNTHFANPHGLTDTNHYTTVYDLYLIFNEAIKYETFNEIIQMSSYQTVYYDKNGKEKKFDKKSTNGFIRGTVEAPTNVTVIGGKTGTTSAAGHCLLLLARDVKGSPYIAAVMGTPSTDELYAGMIELLKEIQK